MPPIRMWMMSQTNKNPIVPTGIGPTVSINKIEASVGNTSLGEVWIDPLCDQGILLIGAGVSKLPGVLALSGKRIEAKLLNDPISAINYSSVELAIRLCAMYLIESERDSVVRRSQKDCLTVSLKDLMAWATILHQAMDDVILPQSFGLTKGEMKEGLLDLTEWISVSLKACHH